LDLQSLCWRFVVARVMKWVVICGSLMVFLSFSISLCGMRKGLWEQLVEAAPMFARYERATSREIPMVLLRPVE